MVDNLERSLKAAAIAVGVIGLLVAAMPANVSAADGDAGTCTETKGHCCECSWDPNFTTVSGCKSISDLTGSDGCKNGSPPNGYCTAANTCDRRT